MNKLFNISEMREVTNEETERAIRRAHQIRSEELSRLFRQFGGWMRRLLVSALAWRPGTAGQVSPLNR